MMKKMNKKAFTLIEVIVVVAVIGILVLLAVPRFIGHSQRAELARIQHDVKMMERELGAELINKDDNFNDWGNNRKNLNQLVQDDELFEKEGIAEEVESIDETYKVIPKEYKGKINTKLKGTFYANSHGKVYYEHGQGPGYSDEEINDRIKQGFIPVAAADELHNVRNDKPNLFGKGTKWEKEYTGGLGKKYIQVANIDLSKYSGEGWNPIGDNSSRFRGTYDGGNYVIRGLEVKGEGKDYQGLFGYTYVATIRNVGLINNKVTGNNYVGGLVGYAYSGNISNSYATGAVTGTDLYVGGLVGYAYENNTISNSYATGSVKGLRATGGLVGLTSEGTISNSYATGSVTGSGMYVGGLVGGAFGGNINNSYWDKETTGQSWSAGGTGKTTAEMKLKETYEGWFFDTVWEITPGNYPTLR